MDTNKSKTPNLEINFGVFTISTDGEALVIARRFNGFHDDKTALVKIETSDD